MLYKDLPYYKVYMLCQEVKQTSYELPKGYGLVYYPTATKEDWCHIQVQSGHIASIKEAKEVFEKEFASDIPLTSSRMLFVIDEHKQAIGTITLWKGKEGFPKNRLHWLGVSDDHAGKGIAKYLVQEACKLADGEIYLDSQTWSYPAIHIYQSLGFQRWNPTAAKDDQEAWDLLDQYI